MASPLHPGIQGAVEVVGEAIAPPAAQENGYRSQNKPIHKGSASTGNDGCREAYEGEEGGLPRFEHLKVILNPTQCQIVIKYIFPSQLPGP